MLQSWTCDDNEDQHKISIGIWKNYIVFLKIFLFEQFYSCFHKELVSILMTICMRFVHCIYNFHNYE